LHDPWLRIEEKLGSDPCGTALCERKPLARGDAFQAVDQSFVSDHFHIGRNCGCESHAHEIKREKVAEKRDGNMARSFRMFNQREFDFAAGESTAILTDAGKDVRRKVPSLKQSECQLFVQRGVRSCCGQYFR